jgi:hypothetical protein
MRFISLSLIFLCALSLAHAEEEKKEGGESGKAAPEMPKEEREFTEKQGKLNVLQNHIEEADKRFQELVREKAEAKSAEEKQVVIKEMVELTNQRNKDAAAFNKLKTDLTYRYPNQGEHLERRYQTQTKRTVEEMEGAAGLDEMLTRTKKLVDRKYAPFQPEQEKPKPKAAAVPNQAEKPERLRLEK